MFNFTGSEKAVAALTPLIAPFSTITLALLAWAGLGEFPDPQVLAQAISYSFVTILGARLVWQVPNTGYVKIPDGQTEEAIEENPPVL